MSSVTIKDIAKLSGVGVSTVSRAINNHPAISAETKSKVMKVIEDNNYIPNGSAISLKKTDSNTIALLIKGISNPFFSSMIKNFENEIQKMKYTFILHKVDQNENEIEIALRLIKEKKLVGIIFLGGYFSHSSKMLDKIEVPFVLSTVNFPYKYKDKYSSVAVDDFAESYKMVDYICKKGHKKIGIIAATKIDESIGGLRLEGYKKALKDNKIKFNEKFCFYMKEDLEGYSMENGYSVMSDVLDSDIAKDITAVYAISDTMAIGACKAIYAKGLSVPEDYSVAGFDGLEFGKYYQPTLTTVEQPIEEIVVETTKLLFDLIKNKSANKTIRYEAHLIEGESVILFKG